MQKLISFNAYCKRGYTNTMNFLSSFNSILLVGALSIDAFVASFAYATSKIKIPFKSALIINVVSTTILGIALFTGSFVSKFIPSVFTTSICTLKALIGPKGSLTRNYEFKVSDFRFFLNVYIDNTAADVDHSLTLSPKESFSLALALSLDGLAAGFGAGLVAANFIQIIIFSLIINIIAILGGCFVGNKIAEKTELNLSWLSGVTLILLAFLKLK